MIGIHALPLAIKTNFIQRWKRELNMKRITLVLVALVASFATVDGAETKPREKVRQAFSPARQQIKAINAIVEKGEASAEDIDLLRKELKNPLPVVRASAAHALGKLGNAAKPAVEELVALAADENPLVRREAVRAVITIRPGPEVALPLVKKMLADADPSVRTRILNALADQGKAALPGLINALKDDEAAKFACLVLTEIGPDAAEAVPALAERLKIEKRPEVQLQIVLALAATESEAAVSALVVELGEAEEATRVAAAYGLGRAGPKAEASEAALTKSLQSTDPVLRAVSAWALVKIKPDDQKRKDETVEILAKSLTSANPLARTAALRALMDLRPGPARVLPIIKQQLAGKDRAAAQEALHALAQMGGPAVPTLIEALKMPEHRPVVAAILEYIGPPAKDAVPALAEIVKTDKNADSRREALMALGGIGPASAPAAPAATAALNDPNEKVAIAACFALAQMGPAANEAVPALKKLAESTDEAIRQEASKALKAISGQ